MEEVQKVLDELKEVRPEKLTGEAKRLFEAIMKIADERDELLKERQLKNKVIELMAEHLTTPIHSKKDVIKYFENKAKESGEIDEINRTIKKVQIKKKR